MKAVEQRYKKLMQPEEVRQIFNITRPTEIAWRNAGKLPEPLVMGRRVYYHADKIEQLYESKIIKEAKTKLQQEKHGCPDSVKTDWPKGIKAPTGEVENDIHTLKMQVKEYVNEIQNHAEKLNDLKKANDNCIDHSGQVFKTLSKRIEELRADITGRIQDKAIQCTNIDKKFNHHSERIEGLKDEVFAKLGNALIELDELKGEISELREQLQNSLQPMDDWKMKVMEYGHRLAKLESVYYYPEPKSGLIRKFWRWLW